MVDRIWWLKYRVQVYTLLLTIGLTFTAILLYFAYHEVIEDENYQFVDQTNTVKDSFLNQLIGASTVLHSFHTVLVSSNSVSLIHQAITHDLMERMTFIEAAINLPVVAQPDLAAFITKQREDDHPEFSITEFDSVTQKVTPAAKRKRYLPTIPDSLINKGMALSVGLDIASLPGMERYIQQAVESGKVVFAPDSRPGKGANYYLALLAVYSDDFIEALPSAREKHVKSIITLFINTSSEANSVNGDPRLNFSLSVGDDHSAIHQKVTPLREKGRFNTLSFSHTFHVNEQTLLLETHKQLYHTDIDSIGFVVALGIGISMTLFLLTLATTIGRHEQRLFNYNQLLLDKKAELLSRETHLKAILENAKDGILTIDAKGIIRSCNSSALAIFGYELEEMLNHNIAMIMPEHYAKVHDQKITNFIESKRTTTNGMGALLEWPATRKNGGLFPLELSTARIVVGDEVMFVGVMRDISQRKEAEKKEQEGKLEHARTEAEYNAKNAFFAMISHEMRTPLASVIGYAESLLDVSATKEHKISSIETIIRNSNHLLHIINEILDLSKINSSDFQVNAEPVSIISIVEDVKELVTLQVKEKKLQFNLNYHFPLPERIEADALRIKQILFNLLDNAVKFTSNGSITVDIKYDSEREQLHIAVIDTGEGISKLQQSKIFGHYQQSDYLTSKKHGGTGLGLSIAKKLAQLHEGDIELTSEIGKGSRFEFYMSVANHKTELLTKLPDEFINPHHSLPISIFKEKQLTGNILVAEDNPDMQGLISYYLKALSVTFTIVSDGQQAVEAAMEREYDLILMDMQMPRMNGIQAVEALRGKGYQRPIVMLTANAMEKDRTTSLEVGCNDFLSKPIEHKHFTAIIMKHLKEVQPTEESAPLKSELINEGLDDLILKFARRLPETITELRTAQTTWDWEKLASVIHQLKGVGGGYGYPQITEVACCTEFHVRRKSKDGVDEGLHELEALGHRITAAIKEVAHA